MSSVQIGTGALPVMPFDNSYARQLPDHAQAWQAQQVANPRLVYWNQPLAGALGLELEQVPAASLAALFGGNQLPAGAQPIAQAYAGHQFGHFNPQLGDGRALLLGELLDPQQRRFDLALKGSGRTPYSRGGDGKAAIGPMLREVLISEALAALGVPTTRSLAVVATGEAVYREDVVPGAVLTRVAASHIRIGTFEYFSARGELDKLRQLLDYTIARHDPEVQGADEPELAFLEQVCQRQARLIAQWMGLGFIHGVMNTDNMSIAGESIDFGPCAFMEAYQADAVFSSIDKHGRYAFSNQPRIAQWNLARLAESLLPIFPGDPDRALARAGCIIEAFPTWFSNAWLQVMGAKLGLEIRAELAQDDVVLIEQWLDLLQVQQVDFTLAWRYLADAAEARPQRLLSLFNEPAATQAWLQRWQQRCTLEAKDGVSRAAAMRRINPWLIPRNQRVEEALAAATHADDLAPFEQLLKALQNPFSERAEADHYALPAEAEFHQHYQTFCGT